MQRFVIPLILALATSVRTIQQRSAMPGYSAASESQIKQALESNYDDTGPGAKGREYAYNTYRTLEEALVSYIDDPDTKLPETERMKALQGLINAPKDYGYTSQPIREYPKSVADYTGYRQIPQIPPIVLKKNTWPSQLLYQNPSSKLSVYNLGATAAPERQTAQPLFKFESLPLPEPVRNPLIPGYFPYLTKVNQHQESYERPQYSTHGIYENSAQESTLSPARGYYNFIDANGNQRTIHYTADDKSFSRHQ